VPRPYNFVRLEQYLQDTFALDRERAAVLAAALRVIVIDPRGALGVFHVWTEPGDWDEWLLDLAGWGVLAYQIEHRERVVALRWIDWDR
jgi:hypothetical protein